MVGVRSRSCRATWEFNTSTPQHQACPQCFHICSLLFEGDPPIPGSPVADCEPKVIMQASWEPAFRKSPNNGHHAMPDVGQLAQMTALDRRQVLYDWFYQELSSSRTNNFIKQPKDFDSIRAQVAREMVLWA